MGFAFTNILKLAMALAGRSDISHIDRSLVQRV